MQRDNPNAGLYISDPYESRLRDSSPSIAMTRRISRPDGSFAGIALIAINLDYFHRLFAGLSLGPHGAISLLIGKSGIMDMRQPYDARTPGRDISKASTFRRFRAAAEGAPHPQHVLPPFVDIDRFKAYNDTYGHQAGDDALAAVARCIRDNIRRPADSAARYGGEEFVVVLPDTAPAGASQIAEQIRSAISALAIEHAGSEFGRPTASIDAASWCPDQQGDVSSVIRAADEALCGAKATGRNRVGQFRASGTGGAGQRQP